MEHAADAVRWLDVSGKGVAVHAPEGSLAARRAQAELHEIERIRAALERVLKPPPERLADPIHVYLVDPVGGDDADRVAETGVIRMLVEELPSRPPIGSVSRFAIARWFGEAAARVPLIAYGVAGVVAAHTEAGPAVADADDVVRSALPGATPLAGSESTAAPPAAEPPSIFSRLESADARLVDGALDPVATSFMAFLLERFGAEAVGRFFADYDAARRDESANTAFRQPLAELEAAWLSALKKNAPARPFHDFFGYLAPMFRPYARRLVEVAVWMAFGLGVVVAAPLLTRQLIDKRILAGDKHGFVITALVLLGLYLGDATVALRRAYVQSSINLHVLMDLRERMFAHLQRLSHSYYTEARVGDVMVRLSQDLVIVQEALSEFGTSGLFSLLTALVALGTLLYMNALLALLVLASLPVLIGVYIFLGVRAARLSVARQQEEGRVATAAQENLTAQSVIKAYGLEEYAVRSYRARLNALRKVSLRLNFIIGALESSTGTFFRLMSLLVIGVGGYLVITGNFTLGTLVAFLALLPSLFSPITVLALTLQLVQMAAGSMVRVRELLDEQPAIEDKPGAAELPPLSGELRLEHVSFGYDTGRPILRDLSLAIPAGGNIAVVGPSGSGKSTVVNLLMRFWDPDEGGVQFDGRDARDVTLASLRGQIGLVFQETFVFDTTLRENIRLGKLGASDAEIRAAAEGARLDGWIESLPAGYDTLLGERGARMSGGQRQRLAIARALLRDPRVLILDEATSALDAETEAGIIETLAEVAKGRTTISITHRLSLAAGADRIFVLDEGRLVEAGAHAELVEAGGLYSRLYEEQTSHVFADGRRPGLRLDRLRAIPLLAHLEGEALAAVADRLVSERFGAGEIVARQGEPGDRFFLITRGQVDVVLERNGYEQRVNTLSEGDFFGEMALLGDGTRAATVKTMLPTDTYSLSRQDLRELVEEQPAIGAALVGTIAERRRALDAALAAVEATSVVAAG
jgi:ATP-binding cassette, subfamily B, bacterial